MCLADLTEIRIMADSTLVPNARDVLLRVSTERTVTQDTLVNRLWLPVKVNAVREFGKTVARVVDPCRLSARVTEVPVRAVEAFVTDAIDTLITAIAVGIMDQVSAWTAEFRDLLRSVCGHLVLVVETELMEWIVSMLILDQALKAKIKGETIKTSDKAVRFRELCCDMLAGCNQV